MSSEAVQPIAFGGKVLPLPRQRWVRILIGSLLVLGGTVGFLPIVGFWMIPLGVIVLSRDVPFIRRWKRMASVRYGRWRAARRAAAAERGGQPG